MDALPAEYTYVYTPLELQGAILSGARDVVIQNHLDLTGLSPQPAGECDGCGSAHLGRIHPWTRLIRVRIFSFLLLPRTYHRVRRCRAFVLNLQLPVCYERVMNGAVNEKFVARRRRIQPLTVLSQALPCAIVPILCSV